MGMRPLPSLTMPLCALVLVLGGCGGDSSDDSAGGGSSGPPPKGTVFMEAFKFSPQTLTVKVGDTVTWVNQDTADHNAVAESDPKLKSELFGKGGKYEYKATKAGTIEYVCTVHPGMEGTLVVE